MRELKFIVRNSPNYRNAIQHIEEICTRYQIKDYSFKEFIDDQIALWVTANGKQYILYLDYTTLELKICTGGETIRVFTKDVCWDNAIEFMYKEVKQKC